MGFFNAIGKFFRRLFGLGEGALGMASDKILTANETTIRAQFRKVREKLLNDHATIRNAIANLMAVNEEKKQDIATLEKKIKELETKKIGAVKKFKETNDIKYQDAFKDCHIQFQKTDEKLKLNREFVGQTDENLERYKRQLIALQSKIEDLKAQEDQAVADIISSRQITKLNEMLAGYSMDVDMQGISVIEEARKKALANAKLSTELTSTSKSDIDEELLAAGSSVDEEFSRMLAQEEIKMIKNTQEERKL
jgi:phage shock protein A